MKDFSNKIRNKRTKALVKVLLTRYAFVIVIPILLYFSYGIGSLVFSFSETIFMHSILGIVCDTISGVLLLFALFIFSMYCIYILSAIIEVLLKMVKIILNIPKKFVLMVKEEEMQIKIKMEEQIHKEMRNHY